MRVIHVSAYYAPAYGYGGPVHSVHALCKAQQAHGIDVEVFTTNAAGSARLLAAPDGRLFDGVPVRYFDLSSPARLLGARDLPAALERAIANADVVHLHGLFNKTIWDAAACLHHAGKPYVLSPRGLLEPRALAHHRWRKRVTWTLKDRAVVQRANVLHATSTFEQSTLQRDYRTSVVKIANPVPLAVVSSHEARHWRDSLGIPADAPIVLSLGRLHRIKRLDLVAAAFLALCRRVPSAHLVIAGPDEEGLRGELESRLETAAAAVHWTGPTHGISKHTLLAAANVLVQCSDSESFGMSVAEALAAGTPVVATRSCPWPDLETRRCGLWVDQTPTAVADALYALVTDRHRAHAMGQAGQRFVDECFSPARVAEAWHAIYRDAACLSPAA
jgi:glycosyltransferase involved in cell wall biosynthesis